MASALVVIEPRCTAVLASNLTSFAPLSKKCCRDHAEIKLPFLNEVGLAARDLI